MRRSPSARGRRAGFYGRFVRSEAGQPTLSQQTGFPGVDHRNMWVCPKAPALTATFPAARRHRIAKLLVPYPTAEPRRIFHFLDDQGYDCNLYFIDPVERSYKVIVQKLARA
jgi:hypothetical protein